MSTTELLDRPPALPVEEKRALVRDKFAALASSAAELTDAELEAAHRALLDIELERLWNRMCDGAQKDMDEGRLDPAAIDRAIKDFRARNPY